MDIGKLKKYSDLAHDINLTKRNSLEKMRARQIMAYDGRLLRADTETINTASTLKSHTKEFYILDTNNNPCLIKDPEDFITKLIERNQETLITLSQLHDSLQRRR